MPVRGVQPKRAHTARSHGPPPPPPPPLPPPLGRSAPGAGVVAAAGTAAAAATDSQPGSQRHVAGAAQAPCPHPCSQRARARVGGGVRVHIRVRAKVRVRVEVSSTARLCDLLTTYGHVALGAAPAVHTRAHAGRHNVRPACSIGRRLRCDKECTPTVQAASGTFHRRRRRRRHRRRLRRLCRRRRPRCTRLGFGWAKGGDSRSRWLHTELAQPPLVIASTELE